VTTTDDVARAIAFFEASFDVEMMRRALAETAPRVAGQVRRQIQRGGNDDMPAPAPITPADEPASQAEALQTLAATRDFAFLQAMTRAIGKRVEKLMEAAPRN
jgi:hypothetical protein